MIWPGCTLIALTERELYVCLIFQEAGKYTPVALCLSNSFWRHGMTCPQCRATNPVGMRFCGHCGAPLPIFCPRCGSENPPENNFCGRCAAPLDRPQDAASKDAMVPSPGELKRVSMLFCDLVDSTGLAERLGPEIWLDARTTAMAGWFTSIRCAKP